MYAPNQEPSSTVNLSVPAGSCMCGRATAEKPKFIPADSKVMEEMKLTSNCKRHKTTSSLLNVTFVVSKVALQLLCLIVNLS